jgi:hypothetical protein
MPGCLISERQRNNIVISVQEELKSYRNGEIDRLRTNTELAKPYKRFGVTRGLITKYLAADLPPSNQRYRSIRVIRQERTNSKLTFDQREELMRELIDDVKEEIQGHKDGRYEELRTNDELADVYSDFEVMGKTISLFFKGRLGKRERRYRWKQLVHQTSKGPKQYKGRRRTYSVNPNAALSPELREELIKTVKHEIEENRVGRMKRFTTYPEFAKKYGITRDNVTYYVLQGDISMEDREWRMGTITARRNKRNRGQLGRRYIMSAEQRKALIELVQDEINQYRLGEIDCFTETPVLVKRFSATKWSVLKCMRRNITAEDRDYRRNVLNSHKNSGSNHYNFNGWSSTEPYTNYFARVMRPYIRERDGHQCLECGTPENGKAHNVHHIDYDKKNDAETNLVLLCDSDHNRIKGKPKRWRIHFQEKIEQIYSETSPERRAELELYKEDLENKIIN